MAAENTPDSTKSTREQFLDKAQALFAERGFYGVSIAAVAAELGLTKQALLHHFGSKEKLYGEVLQRTSEHFRALGDSARSKSGDPATQFKAYLMQLLASSVEQGDQTSLLMRELLDNRRRADSAGVWYLREFLEDLVTKLRAIPGKETLNDTQALALVYQLLGAINYFGISEPTLTGIFGERQFKQLDATFPSQFEALIDAVVKQPPPANQSN